MLVPVFILPSILFLLPGIPEMDLQTCCPYENIAGKTIDRLWHLVTTTSV